MVLHKTILILEDNLSVVSRLLHYLYELEQDQPYDFSVIWLTTSEQVQDYINNNPRAEFDIVIMDRDCKLHRSFHIFDWDRFGVDNVISISSVPEYNEEAKRRGVDKVVLKTLEDVDGFAVKVVEKVSRLLRPVF